MTELDALIDLLDGINTSADSVAVVSSEQLAKWPECAVDALKRQHLLTKTKPADTVTCPGCERQCAMPVQHQLSNDIDRPFVVCDKRPDINRVAINPESQNQWRCDLGLLRSFIAVELGVNLASAAIGTDGCEVGLAHGRRKTQMLLLRRAKQLELVAGTADLALEHVLSYRESRYTVDVAAIRQLVDTSSTIDPRYTPTTVRREIRKLGTESMREEWRREHRVLQDRKPGMTLVWYANQIARSGNGPKRSAETIRKCLAS